MLSSFPSIGCHKSYHIFRTGLPFSLEKGTGWNISFYNTDIGSIVKIFLDTKNKLKYFNYMRKRSSKGKKPDINELAKSIVAQATNPQPEPKTNYGDKNPAAVELGRLGGLKGGKARAAKMTAKQRSDAARLAALAGWRKRRNQKP
jgi:hypothetical protein